MADNLGKVTKITPKQQPSEAPLVDNQVFMHGAGCLFGAVIALGIWALVAITAWVFL